MQRRLLICFCRHPRQVLSKQFLMDEVWGHQEVSVVSLARTVHGLRRKLVESELPDDLIRNIYSEGYLFTLPVETIGSGETSSPAPSFAMVGSSARSDARTATLESPRR
jgi:DNA-binding winged helix-turn-helix (wHTH) protein